MRLGKTEKILTRDGILTLRRRMIGLEQVLAVDHNRCCGCRDCEKICPHEAVSASEPVVGGGTVTKHVTVDLDPEKCTFCGQCYVICPTKAVSWRENEKTVPTVIAAGILPALDEDIEIRVEACRIDCELACQAQCPVEAIAVKIETGDGQSRIVEVAVNRDSCFYCGKCEPACPYELISVRRARSGLVYFAPEHCPPDCRACTEVCPTGAFNLESGRVELNEKICIYCRACSNVCPVDEALEVKRERIRVLPLRSQLWLELQGKLVSPAARIRLIREKAAFKRERAFRTRID